MYRNFIFPVLSINPHAYILQKKEIKDKNNGDHEDDIAINIRNKCMTPINIYWTCYEQAADPNNDLDHDKLQVDHPFQQFSIDHDKWLISNSIHLVFIQQAESSRKEGLDYTDSLDLKELSLNYLKVYRICLNLSFHVCTVTFYASKDRPMILDVW